MRQPFLVNGEILTHCAIKCEPAGSQLRLNQSHTELMVHPIEPRLGTFLRNTTIYILKSIR